MNVTVSGLWDGEQASLTWNDGEITGDAALKAALDLAVNFGGEVELTPVGPWYRRGTDDIWQFVATVSDVLDGDVTWKGDLPALAKLPVGAES